MVVAVGEEAEAEDVVVAAAGAEDVVAVAEEGDAALDAEAAVHVEAVDHGWVGREVYPAEALAVDLVDLVREMVRAAVVQDIGHGIVVVAAGTSLSIMVDGGEADLGGATGEVTGTILATSRSPSTRAVPSTRQGSSTFRSTSTAVR